MHPICAWLRRRRRCIPIDQHNYASLFRCSCMERSRRAHTVLPTQISTLFIREFAVEDIDLLEKVMTVRACPCARLDSHQGGGLAGGWILEQRHNIESRSIGRLPLKRCRIEKMRALHIRTQCDAHG